MTYSDTAPSLPAKNYKCSFKFAKVIVKKSTVLFSRGHMCILLDQAIDAQLLVSRSACL